MDPHLWELQQAAEQRVQRMRQQSRLIAEQQGRRTPASLRAARPTADTPPAPIRESAPTPPEPVADLVLSRQPDPERRMLLLLTLLLARSGASPDLLLILLYLAL